MNPACSSLIRFVDPADLEQSGGSITSDEVAVLDEINAQVAGTENFEAIMDFVFERTKDIFPCDRIGIAFLEDRGRRVVSRAVRTRYPRSYLGTTYSEGLAGSSLKTILEQGHLRVIHDLERYLEENPESHSTKLLVQEGLASSLTCPLVVEGRPLGFFFRSSKKKNAYTDRELLLHTRMAARLSQAVEKTWRIEQLRAANKGYMEMLAFASHELKSPLASMSMECDMLLEGHAGELSEAQRLSITRMHGKVRALMETADDYLSLARFEGNQLGIKIVNGLDALADLIYPALEQLNAQVEARGMKISIEPPEGVGAISCDPAAMQTVFLNLIGNAVKYGTEGGAIKITLTLSGGRFNASVWNEGPGFPAEERQKLFKRFSRLYVPEFRKIRGTGVGLYIVWQLVDLHNGRVGARSEYGKWAEFNLTIPQPAGL